MVTPLFLPELNANLVMAIGDMKMAIGMHSKPHDLVMVNNRGAVLQKRLNQKQNFFFCDCREASALGNERRCQVCACLNKVLIQI